MRWSQLGNPAVCDSRWRTRTVSSLPASANSGQYFATGASTSTRPRLASTSSDRHDIVFVVENTLMIVSSSHGTVPAASWVPPHRSTTSSPSIVTATDAPTSPSTAKFSAKASLTLPNPSPLRPLMSTIAATYFTGAVKISVEFPSIAYREGPAKVAELARAIESIGFDDLAVFDHVVMGYEKEDRRAPMYPSQMPILEALITLGFVAAVTERVTLSTEVLVLPQRQAVLVAKQVSTLDTLSGGRVRLGVGVGWQEAEYEALGADFSHRGRVIDEAIALLRACWADERIDHRSGGFHVDAIAMEPKPPQGGDLPIWVGGTAPAALRRAGRLGAGWMGMVAESP